MTDQSQSHPGIFIDQIQQMLILQNDEIAQTITTMIEAVDNVIETENEQALPEVVNSVQDAMMACDRFYEAMALVLSEHIKDMAGKRRMINNTIAGLAEINGRGNDWADARAQVVKLSKPSHLRLIDSEPGQG